MHIGDIITITHRFVTGLLQKYFTLNKLADECLLLGQI